MWLMGEAVDVRRVNGLEVVEGSWGVGQRGSGGAGRTGAEAWLGWAAGRGQRVGMVTLLFVIKRLN